MIVGVDLDGVTLDFNRRWRDLYYEWFGIKPTNSGSWHSLVEDTHFDSFDDFFYWFARAGGWEGVPYVPGAPGGIDELLRLGHQVWFVTARQGYFAGTATHRWFQESPWATSARLYMNQQEKSVQRCTIYVDDAPHVVADVTNAGRPALLFDRPWNQGVKETELITRVSNWTEVIEQIKKKRS